MKLTYQHLEDALHYFRTYGADSMKKDDTIQPCFKGSEDMNETLLINCIKDNLNRDLGYIDQHNMPDMIGYKKGIRHTMQVMDVFLNEYKAEKMARLKKVWASSAGPLQPLQPLQPLPCNNTTINLISRVSNIAGRVDLIRKIANEYEDHIDDVLDELDKLLNYLFENLND